MSRGRDRSNTFILDQSPYKKNENGERVKNEDFNFNFFQQQKKENTLKTIKLVKHATTNILNVTKQSTKENVTDKKITQKNLQFWFDAPTVLTITNYDNFDSLPSPGKKNSR